MREPEPDIQTIQLADVSEPLLRLVGSVSRREARVVVESEGETVAALVSAEDLRRLSELDRAWDERTSAIERFSRAFADVSDDEVEADVTRIIAQQRAAKAAETLREAG